jgi:glycosyltransferase involved in cell wall biosynthesis
MAEPPLISVLLPVFDTADTLGACLRSIQRQTEPHWQCVIVDDGSGDHSRAIAARFAAEDRRFRVVPHATACRHQGLVAALNRGLDHCSAPYVARMDADDVMHRERLRAQRRALDRHPSWAAVGCHVRLFPRDGLTDGLRRYEQWLNSIDSPDRLRREVFVECPLAHPSLMLRREPLLALRYRNRGWAEDYDLVLRLLAAGHDLGVVRRRLLSWRDSPGRLWRTDPAYQVERFTECKAHFLARTFLADADRYVLWGYGETGRLLRRALLTHGKRPSHIVELHPGRLGQRIHGAPVIPPAALAALRGAPVVVSVAGEVARNQIRALLDDLEQRELDDYVVCA